MATCGSTTTAAVVPVVAVERLRRRILRTAEVDVNRPFVLSGVVVVKLSSLSSLSEDDETTSISNNMGIGGDCDLDDVGTVICFALVIAAVAGSGSCFGTFAVVDGAVRWYKKNEVRPFLFCK